MAKEIKAKVEAAVSLAAALLHRASVGSALGLKE